MAMVRISRDLVHVVLSKADDSFSIRLNRERENPNLPMTGDEIYERTFGMWYNGMMSMPREFFNFHSSLTISRVKGVTCNLNTPLSVEKPFPMDYAQQDMFSRARSYSRVSEIDLHGDEWNALYDAVLQWKERIDSVATQRATFRLTLEKLLGKHTTLASALKEWPPLWDFLTDEVKDRHNAPTVRSRKVVTDESPKPEVNTDTLTSLATLNKITL